jgi:hypothetical protein
MSARLEHVFADAERSGLRLTLDAGVEGKLDDLFSNGSAASATAAEAGRLVSKEPYRNHSNARENREDLPKPPPLLFFAIWSHSLWGWGRCKGRRMF